MASRIEELRKKLRSKPFDEEFSNFNSKVDAVLNAEKSASASSTKFMHNLYESFLDEKPTVFRDWLDLKLLDLFKSIGAGPIWVNDPTWCFFEDQPMTFMHQFLDENGTTLYVFRGKRPGETGWRAVYKMTAQDPEGQIIMEGEILS